MDASWSSNVWEKQSPSGFLPKVFIVEEELSTRHRLPLSYDSSPEVHVMQQEMAEAAQMQF